MSFDDLLSTLRTLPVRLQRDGEHLAVLTAEGTLPQALLENLRTYKAALLDIVDRSGEGWTSPAYVITPDMVSLVKLSVTEIERIVATVPGGAANVQDIYPCAPLQDVLLFNRLMIRRGDPYLLRSLYRCRDRERLDGYVRALQAVVDRHDILRTAIHWEDLAEPVQVVWRHAPLIVEEVTVDPSVEAAQYLCERFDPRHYRFELERAPLMRLFIAHDAPKDQWLLLQLISHFSGDHTTLSVMRHDIEMHLSGRADELVEPVPFRDFIARLRLQAAQQAHEQFFRRMLGDFEAPSLPYGLANLQGDGSGMREAQVEIAGPPVARLRNLARSAGVSVGSLFHLLWARVIARLSGTEDVVFGTLLSGRLRGEAGHEAAMGVFTNTLPIRLRMGGVSSLQAARQTHAALAALLDHEHASLALAQRCSPVAAPTPLFTALLNYRSHPAEDLQNEISPAWEGIDLLDIRDIDRSAHAPSPPISTISLAHDLHEKCIHELFEACARSHAMAPALRHEHEQLSYSELNERANSLAHHLRTLGVGPDVRVGICVERSLDMVVGLLGILKAGGAYVPLDPAYPEERLKYMLEDSAPALLLTQASLLQRCAWRGALPTVVLDAAEAPWLDQPGDDLEPRAIGLTPRNLAYVMYTSGSTGHPKGVMIEHRGLVNLTRSQARAFEIGAGSRLLQFASFSFDACIWELVIALCEGATVLIPPRGVLLAGEALRETLECNAISHVLLPPAALASLPEIATLDSVRTLIVGGDALRANVARRWSTGRKLFNAYGPTEITVCATLHLCEATVTTDPPIGRPNAGTRVYVLDESMQPVEHGRGGELYLGGEGVARGYRDRPQLTAERFIPDPFADEHGARMYRTGDLGRWRTDGALEFIGRNDAQVKVRGYRIELGEIEAHFRTYPGIADAVVLARTDEGGEQRLVAYYTVSPPQAAHLSGHDHAAAGAALRAHLLSVLPEYMVPAAYVQLESFPRTVNGKLDRAALPGPEEASYARAHYEPPSGKLETLLAKLWCDVLGVELVGRGDNFFDLGGHSLVAIRLLERMRHHELSADVSMLFAASTLAEFARALRSSEAEAPVPPNLIPPDCEHIRPEMLTLVKLDAPQIERVVGAVPGGARNVQDIYPLAPLQEGILFHHLMDREADPYVLCSIHAFADRATLKAYLTALQSVIDAHDVLRTSVQWEGLSEPVQVVWRRAPLSVQEIAVNVESGDVLEQLRRQFDPRAYRIDLRQAPLMHAYVTQDTQHQRWLMLQLYHHFCIDHVSAEALEREVYARLREEPAARESPVPFRNFVARACQDMSLDRHERFFREMLKDVDEPTTAFGLTRTHSDGRSIQETWRDLDSRLAMRLREKARAAGVSVASLWHLAWARVLARASGRNDVVFGTVLSGRAQTSDDAERAMGVLINTLPIRVRVTGNGLADLTQTQAAVANVLRHVHAPLAVAQRCSAISQPQPLFNTVLNFHHGIDAPHAHRSSGRSFPGIELLAFEERSSFPLILNVSDVGTGFVLNPQVAQPVDPELVCDEVMQQLRELLEAGDRPVSVAPAAPPVAQEGIDINQLLMLNVDDLADKFLLSIEAQAPLRPEKVCAYVQSTLEQVLDALANQPDLPLCAIDGLPLAERQQSLAAWNATHVAGERRYVHEWIERQVLEHPSAVAIAHHDVRLTYEALNERANRLARYLVRRGAKPGTRVAVCGPRCVDLIVGILAVLKAGSAYVPLDPEYPTERLRSMLEASEPLVVLIAGSEHPRIDEVVAATAAQAHWIDMRADAESWSAESKENLAIELTPTSPAYIICTSGSTGIPKAAQVMHRGLGNLLSWYIEDLGLTAADIVLLVTSHGFDLTQKSILGPLAVGGTLHLAAEPFDPTALADQIQREGITFLNLAPSAFHAVIDADESTRLRSLRRVVLGGEAIQATRLLTLPQPRPEIFNSYGPTECSDVVAWHRLDANLERYLAGGVPLGVPVRNLRLYVLDAFMVPVPAGVQGEIYIGGEGVGTGYLNQPWLTAERFVPDPFAPDSGARMYRSGDLGRHLPDGQLQFLGRNDFQVKLRGLRIELEEIESRLARHEAVNEVAVLAREDSPGNKRLVAYYTPANPQLAKQIGAEKLRAHLLKELPEYMVPAAYVMLDELPLTANGKLDRRALPAPEAHAYAAQRFEPPEGPIERQLAAVWSEVLKLARIGRADNFFDLGGHSLLAVRVVSRVRQALGVEVALSELFAHPVLKNFAQVLKGAARSTLPPITRADRSAVLPLSFAQQRLWFLSQMEGASRAYHIALGLRLTGALNSDALGRVLDSIVARHEALRTSFELLQGESVQRIGAKERGFPLRLQDLRGHADVEAEVRAIASREADDPFDLNRGPLIRGRLLRVGEQEHVLLLTLHHIVADGWSLGVLAEELSELYTAYSQGRDAPLPEPAIQYADYALWQRRWLAEDVLPTQLEYWKQQLSGAPVLRLPTDRPRPEREDHVGDFVELALDEALTRALKALAQRRDTTLFVVLLAAWSVVLCRLSGQREVVIGCPVAGRNRLELEPLIGFFVNTLALRLDVSGQPTWRELLQRVQVLVLDAQRNADLPFERLVEVLRPARSLSWNPLFQVAFAWQNNEEGEFRLPGLTVTAQRSPETTALFDLRLDLGEFNGRILGGIEYATALFDKSTVQRQLDYLLAVLQTMVADDSTFVSQVRMLHAEDDVPLISRNIRESHDDHRCIHELFELQARSVPDAIAVIHGDERITYGELNRRADALALHLTGLGVAPESRVALCVSRGLDMIVGMLAILKAGGAYVPIDPTHPPERRAYILRDSAPALLLAQSALGPSEVPVDIPTLYLDTFFAGSVSDALVSRSAPAPESLAYLIYTSGSTGMPKGVMVEHRHVTRLFNATRGWFGFGRHDAWTLFHSATFDFSVWEIWGALLHGGQLIIVPQMTARSPFDFYDLVCAAGVTVLNLTPSAFRQLIDAQQQSRRVHALREVILGGEALDSGMLAPWYQDRRNDRTRIVNMYGITETTVHVTYRPMRVEDAAQAGRSPIGQRISDLTTYVLDSECNPVPDGVVGELYVGGAGVSRGYLNQPALTAQRFLPDPFTAGRMYRSGDLVKVLPGDELEFVGRNDFQVKIRGFRIELGEIEAKLRDYPGVAHSIVEARDDAAGDRKLVAYIVPQFLRSEAELLALSTQHVEEWSELYEQTYSQPRDVEVGLDLTGWNSSYTRQAIPAEQMRDWRDGVLRRIVALKPQRVLELGCGTGMLLLNIGPGTRSYVATDVSSRTLQRLQQRIGRMPELKDRVELMRRPAADFSGLPEGNFDTVILNSVVQYFPSIHYLLDVLRKAVRRTAPGGHIFIGDVRHYRLLQAFHLSVQLHQAPDGWTARALQTRVLEKVRSEVELAIDPAWFAALSQWLPEITQVRVLPRQGAHQNEMSAYRYDVVLCVGGVPDQIPSLVWIDCAKGALSLDVLEQKVLHAESRLVGLRSIPNARTRRDAETWDAVLQEIHNGRDDRPFMAPRRDEAVGVGCAELAAFCAARNFQLSLSWLPNDAWGGYHALIAKYGEVADIDWRALCDQATLRRDSTHFATDPLSVKQSAQLPEKLRAHLLKELPEYMVPAAYVMLDELPLTANGKLDRRALPAPEAHAYAAQRFEPPEGPIERQLAAVWSEVLKLARIGRADNFFDLGGHSLLAVRVVSRVRQALGVEVALSEIFAHPVLKDFGQVIMGAARSALPPITRADRSAVLPLSFAQQRLWFLSQMEGASRAYHIALGLRLQGPLDRMALRAALDRIVARHEALRTRFVAIDDEVRQCIEAQDSGFTLREEAISNAALAELAQEEIAAEFDLQRGPLIRGRLLQLAESEHVLLITMHHIVSDGWSMGVLVEELSELYTAYSQGRNDPLPEVAIQYADYALWQRRWLAEDVSHAQLEYWKQQLSGAPALLALPTVWPRPPRQDYTGGFVAWRIDAPLTQALRQFGQRNGTTPFMTCMAAWATVLSRLSGQRDLVIGTPVANRGRSEVEPLIGLFINTLALRLDLSGHPTFAELAERTRNTVLEAQRHQDVPFEQVVEVTHPPRSLAHSPLFQVMLVWQSDEVGELRLPGIAIEPLTAASAPAKFDLTLYLSEIDGCLTGGFEYATALFDAPAIERHGEYLRSMLREMVADERQRIELANLLTVDERQRLLIERNATQRPYPVELCVHELFERQVASHPHSIAIECQSRRLSYGALNQRATCLAARLRRLGVRPDQRVALSMERGIDLIVAVLATLKAGGAYVPLDPSYPVERLTWMLQHCAPVVLLTHESVDAKVRAALGDACEQRGVHVLEVTDDDEFFSEGADRQASAAQAGVSAQNLAYVIYTSGSTGRPKGVAIEHRSVVNFLLSMREQPGLREHDVMLAMTSPSFDIAGLEWFLPLICGAKVVCAPRAAVADPMRLAALMKDSAVTVMQATPSTWRMLMESGVALPPGLKILCGGESLTKELTEQLLVDAPAIWNLYGPTETTIWSSMRCVVSSEVAPPIGEPIANTRIYLLDEHLNAVPLGVVGELHIGGEGLARGYFNEPGVSATSFVPDPFSQTPGARIYKTGDLGRYRADGTLECLGRTDHQVKIRGFRVEPGEIESLLARHPDVQACAVVARDTQSGGRKLTAYVAPAKRHEGSAVAAATPVFSLFYFGADEQEASDRYRLYFAAARYADENGFEAVWTPERHFDSVGGLYPNPATLNAALATITRRVGLRAGSVVLPLHDTVRVAEDWSVIDNLSNGRAGLSVASGWLPRDFVLAAEKFSIRKRCMFDEIDVLRALWRGESIERSDGTGKRSSIRIFPPPVQRELPLWITCAGNPETFVQAGRLGANVLTHLLGQSVEAVAANIACYRQSLAQHGFDPEAGRVTLMIHTFLDDEHARALARAKAPFVRYLRAHVGLAESWAQSMDVPMPADRLIEGDIGDLVELAFDRYANTASLIGAVQTCLPMVRRLHEAGVDEIACLVDWMGAEDALGGLPQLLELRKRSQLPALSARDLLKDLRTRLPGYMIPSEIVVLDALPLTPNGKLDRSALPAPVDSGSAAVEYEAPSGAIETRLEKIWCELLERERIGRHDDFFELGGHSLLAVSLVARMRREGFHVDLSELFVAPTIAALAAVTRELVEITL